MGAWKVAGIVVAAVLLMAGGFALLTRMQIFDTGRSTLYHNAIADGDAPTPTYCTAGSTSSTYLASYVPNLANDYGVPSMPVTRIDLWLSTPPENAGPVTLTVGFGPTVTDSPTSGMPYMSTAIVAPGKTGGYVGVSFSNAKFESGGGNHAYDFYLLRVTAHGAYGDAVRWHEGTYPDYISACGATPYTWRLIHEYTPFAYRVFNGTQESIDTAPPGTDGDATNPTNATGGLGDGNGTDDDMEPFWTQPVVIGVLFLFGFVLLIVVAIAIRRPIG